MSEIRIAPRRLHLAIVMMLSDYFLFPNSLLLRTGSGDSSSMIGSLVTLQTEVAESFITVIGTITTPLLIVVAGFASVTLVMIASDTAPADLLDVGSDQESEPQKTKTERIEDRYVAGKMSTAQFETNIENALDEEEIIEESLLIEDDDEIEEQLEELLTEEGDR